MQRMSCVCAWSFAAGDSEAGACSGLQRVKLYAACCVGSGCRMLPLWGRTSTFTARPVACSPRTKLSKTSCDRTASVPTNRPRDDSRAKINGGSHCRTMFTVATEPKPSHSVRLRSPARHYPTDNDAWRSAEWRSAMSQAAASAAIPCVPRVALSWMFQSACRAGSGSTVLPPD
jgi:hypothetical protein